MRRKKAACIKQTNLSQSKKASSEKKFRKTNEGVLLEQASGISELG
jgi:hypothetical protein